MPGQPIFLGEGTTVNRNDTEWVSLVKQLGALQNTGSPIPANNPRRSDTKPILQRKITHARNGTAYSGS